MFTKILIANRGEIACRIARTAKQLGVQTVAVHSAPDAASRHVRLADEAVDLGDGPASENYLNPTAIIEAALHTGAEAIHPGYGFLSENAAFADAVTGAGLVFIGPPASAMSAMGEKVSARALAIIAQVPLAPGSDGAVATPAEAAAFGAQYGYPILIKASHGGGGRGMRRVDRSEDVAENFDAAVREATAAFGNGEVYVERYLVNARHVEVQVLADDHGSTLWLGDRDCSVQRRHQKLIEEAPAPGLSDAMRQAMGEAAARLAREVGYRGAGTVEFLVEGDDFYFLEMNTRIQVEHPVTEEVLGIDLIAEQLRIAAGEPTTVAGSGPTVTGVAVEARVNAEDVAGGLFLPAPGTIERLVAPTGPGIRFDTGFESGDTVLPLYDSLIGKLIAHGATRDEALDRLEAALRELVIDGVPTTAPAALRIIGHDDFRSVRFSTLWLESTVDFSEEEEPASRYEVEVAGRVHVIPTFPDGGTAAAPAATAAAAAPSAGASPARRATRRNADDGPHVREIKAAMQGTIAKVNVALGDVVAKGDVLFVLEAMKMENPVRASGSGTVVALHTALGASVAAGVLLAEVDAEGAAA